MKEYHKIQSIYKRDPNTNYKTFLRGQYTLPEFEYLSNLQWTWTEKVDGTNIRISVQDNGGIHIGGRTNRAQLSPELIRNIQNLINADKFKECFGDDYENFTLYGEGYGPGIQKVGVNYRTDKSFVLFDVMSNNTTWLERDSVIDIASKLDIDVVPIIGKGTLHEAEDFVRNSFKSTWGDFLAEGIVARPEVELCTRRGDRIITKIKTVDYINT